MKRQMLESQCLLKVGDKFSLFKDDRPHFEVVSMDEPGVFTVKRIPSGIIDAGQRIPHPSGDNVCWVWR